MKKIKLFDPVIDKAEEKTVQKVLKSKFWASGGGTGNVGKFEKKFKNYVNSKECVAVNNGTAALHLALALSDIRGKEVILPSLSFVSTAHAVVYNGGKPVFADVDPNTLCIDPLHVKELLTSKTKVILPVHFAGMASDLTKLSKICKENRIDLVEDAAHAAGTRYNHSKIGSHGLAVCFSFHPVKNLGMPTGGAVTLNGKSSSTSRKFLDSMRWCGITNRKDWDYDITKLGWNFYMNEFSAAIGLEQLKKLDKMNLKRRNVAGRYYSEIHINEKMPLDRESSYHFYWILVKNRDQFIKNLKNEGIEVGVHYKPIHQMTYYRSKTILPETEIVGEKIVSIPTHPNLSDSDIDRVIRAVNKYT
jgi:perosamine synthetase